jgi:MoaA/NifB/PqqE/SkfB family radical SAM enzyme
MPFSHEIRTGLKVLAARLTGRRIPFFVQLMPTERCNLRCRYCYAQFGDRHRPDFPIDSLLKVIDGLAQLGTRNIMVAGGEPLLRKDIGRIVDRITGHNIRCSVNTNGILIPDRIDQIAKADMLSISLDGTREINDWYRGEGSYDRVIAGIKLARQRKIRVQIQLTLTRDLKRSFEHVNKIAEELGCFIGLNFLRPQERINGSVVEAGEGEDGEIKGFLVWLKKSDFRTLPYPPHLIDYVLGWPYEFGRHVILEKNELAGFAPIPCQAGKMLIAIDNTGDIFPCTKLFYSQPLGNCADGNIERAWAQLKPVNCQACLDLGCNLINSILRFNPIAIRGLLSTWRATKV